jgi:hypothetical protein
MVPALSVNGVIIYDDVIAPHLRPEDCRGGVFSAGGAEGDEQSPRDTAFLNYPVTALGHRRLSFPSSTTSGSSPFRHTVSPDQRPGRTEFQTRRPLGAHYV